MIPQSEKIKLQEAKLAKEQLKQIKLNISKGKYSSEYAFMKDVKSIDDLREKIKIWFWADAWAISKIEDMLNIKVIILSSDNYSGGLLIKIIQYLKKKKRNKS